MEYRANAIVLKKKEVGETDRLYTLYTDSFGKMQVVAKGVRKGDAKLAGQLENLMLSQLIIVKGRGAGKIAGAVAEKSFISLRSDIDILKRVLEVVSIFDRLVGLDQKDPELFHLLEDYLTLANDLAKENKKAKILLLSEGFLFQLFAHLGYEIETGVCAVSGERLRVGENHFFSPSAGGVLSGEHTRGAAGAIPISENAIKLIRLFLRNKLEALSRIQVEDGELRETRRIASRFFQWIDA